MAAKAARDAKLNAARAEMLQALRKAEAKVAANTAPATWETYARPARESTRAGSPRLRRGHSVNTSRGDAALP